MPAAYGLLIAAMERDRDLRRAFFAELDMIFYAGASLPQDMWTALERMALDERGEMPLMASSWGMTETAPAAIMVHAPITRAGLLGAPLPGVTVKLIPDAGMRCELRVKGPNVTPGYFRDPERTAAAFDDEGYLITGDAVRLVDPAEPSRGLAFDGRVAEDFKLATGTWVHVSRLRIEALPVLAPLVQDLVITGHDRAEIGALLVLNPAALTARGIAVEARDGALVGPSLAAALADGLRRLAALRHRLLHPHRARARPRRAAAPRRGRDHRQGQPQPAPDSHPPRRPRRPALRRRRPRRHPRLRGQR